MVERRRSHEKYCSASIMLEQTAVMTTSVELVENDASNVVGGACHPPCRQKRIKPARWAAGSNNAPAATASSAWRASRLHLRDDGGRRNNLARRMTGQIASAPRSVFDQSQEF
jgi:hypothetical protein